MKKILFIISLFFIQFSIFNIYAQDIASEKYLPKTIIFKVKPEFRGICEKNAIKHNKLNEVFQQLDVNTIAKKFPNHIFQKAPGGSVSLPPAGGEDRGGAVDLSLIYELNYTAGIPLQKAINRLYSTGMIEYAQPHYIHKPLYVPNDPAADSATGLQYFLNNIRAYEAWGINKGDTNVVIGIVDTGTDIDHPDLLDNIKYNYADTIDGIDNDNDGFVDNFSGWDLGDNDNDPSTGSSADPWHHGVYVSGIAAATTDNGLGVAGVGFKCKFLPVKVSEDNVGLTMSYEGIVYAADHGCQIINCSWGGHYTDQYEQDIINYATFNKDVLIIAAAGNDNNECAFYPASLNNVISVAGVDASDVKTSSSSYGINIDVCTPGTGIYTTLNGGYGYTGPYTSFAAPIAAGGAALIKANFPSYTALQVGEQLKVTSDYIDTVSGNENYAGKLGSGRINLYRALTETSSPSIVMTQKNIIDGNDSVFAPGDTLRISGIFTNYLAPASNLLVILSSTSPYLNIIDGTTTLGSIATLATADNYSDPFTVKILSSMPYNKPIELKLNYYDGSYNAFEYIGLDVNPDYINIDINDVATTITSKSRIGFNEDNQDAGLGFKYMGEQLLWEAGLMIGNSTGQVSDNVRENDNLDNDFARVVAAKKVIPPEVSDLDVEGVFNDDSASTDKLNVSVKHKAFAWNTPADSKYIIAEYYIINNGSGTLDNLFAGIFADWDIMDPGLNKASFDVVNKMGYVFSSQSGSPYAGIKLLTNSTVTHYAIDHIPGGAGGVDLTNGYSTAEKYQTLSSNRSKAGENAGGNDVMHVVGSGSFDLLPGDTVVVAFALLAGDDLAELQAIAQTAQNKYNEYAYPEDTMSVEKLQVTSSGLQVYPNPVSKDVLFEFRLSLRNDVELNLYNLMGMKIADLVNTKLIAGKYQYEINVSDLISGIYYYQFKAGSISETGKLIVIK
ncbi:MAG: S8/S53 family peptidase [Bacteroidota bacterium]